jgi:hypothetical protein
MKKLTLLTMISLGAVVTTGAVMAAAFIGKDGKGSNEAAPLAAANMTTSDTIFFNKSAYASDSTWKDQDVYFRYYTGSANGFLTCTKMISGNDQYWYVKPSSLSFSTNGGFCFRAASSGQDDYKETKWISWSTWSAQANNAVLLSGSNDSSDSNRANYSTESWNEVSSAQGGTVVYNNVNSSNDTERIWVRSSASWWYSDSARTAIRVWTTVDSTTTVNIYKTTAILNEDDGLYYWYADVPTSITGLQFVRLDGTIDRVYNYSEDGDKAHTAGVNYLYTQDGHSNLSVSFAGVDNPNPTLCQKVLAGFTTCSSSAVNGYGAYSALNTNFISKLTSSEVTSFNALAITDYSYDQYVSNGKSYGGIMKSVETTAGAKWAQMASLSGSSALFVGKTTDSASIASVTAVACIGALAAGAFFLVRRKHIA